MTIRKYSSRAQQTTLSGSLDSSATSTTVVSGANLMGGKTPGASETYTVVIDPDTASEEIVDISNYASGNTITIARGIDGSTGTAHSAGAIVRHMIVGRDLTEANNHIENSTTAHGLTIANVVTTASSGVVTSTMITNDTIVNADVNSAAAIAYSKLNLSGGIVTGDIANDTIMNADINTAADIAWTKIAPSSTVSATELGYLDGVTSAIQTQIDSKLATATASSTYAPLASPALTGVPTAPTAAANTNTTQLATTAYVQTEISDLIASAPGALDTLDELAAALGDDANFATTVTNSLAAKLPLAGGTMSGAIAMGTSKITGLGNPTLDQDAATKYYTDNLLVAPGNLTGPITSVGVATAIASQTGTGTKFVVDTSPTLVTPVLGVATATSINGTTIPSTKTLVVTTDKLSALAGTTSAELAGVISDETGTGALVFANTPTLVTPVLGVATATSVNGTTIPTSKTLVVTTDKISALAATTSSELRGVISDESGTGALVFADTPTLVTPVLGVATATSINGTSIPTSKTLMATDTLVTAGTTTTSKDGIGYMGIPQNATTTGSATVAAADGGKHIYASATRTITIDSNANLALPIGFTVSFIAGSGATMTIAITTDTMYLAGPGTTGSRTLAPFGMATAVKLTSTTWIISGNGLT